jgi:hypothetical protein
LVPFHSTEKHDLGNTAHVAGMASLTVWIARELIASPAD